VEPDGTSSGLKWVRNQDWKLYNDGRLFHMAKDPLEKRPFTVNQDGPNGSAMRKKLLQAFKKLGLSN
jgi:arylsulfatase A